MFGLSLDFYFKTKNKMVVACLRVGGWRIFSLQNYSLLIKRLCTDFQLDAYPETGRKVWWWWWLYVNLVFYFGPNLLV